MLSKMIWRQRVTTNSMASSSNTFEKSQHTHELQVRGKTNRFQTLNEFLRRLVIFEMFNDEHNQVFFLHLTEEFNHETFDQRLKFTIDKKLMPTRQP